MTIRSQKTACETCPTYHHMQAGHLAFFEENCTPMACLLNRYRASPRVGLWSWFQELIGFQRSGLESLTADALRASPARIVRAFVAFRWALESAEREAQQAGGGRG